MMFAISMPSFLTFPSSGMDVAAAEVESVGTAGVGAEVGTAFGVVLVVKIGVVKIGAGVDVDVGMGVDMAEMACGGADMGAVISADAGARAGKGMSLGCKALPKGTVVRIGEVAVAAADAGMDTGSSEGKGEGKGTGEGT